MHDPFDSHPLNRAAMLLLKKAGVNHLPQGAGPVEMLLVKYLEETEEVPDRLEAEEAIQDLREAPKAHLDRLAKHHEAAELAQMEWKEAAEMLLSDLPEPVNHDL